MAAVRSGAAAGFRTTKGLFFFSTLLILICFTSSLTQDNQLEKIKINHQKIKKQFERLNNMIIPALVATSKMMVDHMQLINRMIVMMKEANGSDEDFLLMERRLKEMRALLKHNVDFVNNKMDDLIVELREQQHHVDCIDMKIKVLEK